jgi:SpoVK/Ycf46/Vps4 family AAA+-type ATPase
MPASVIDPIQLEVTAAARGAPREPALALDDLLPALRRLDRLIERAVRAAAASFCPDSADPYRGLVIRADEVERLLRREPATPTLIGHGGSLDDLDLAPSAPGLLRLGRVFGLSTFELDTILIALAPELDLRYERLYAYLHDDVTRKRPSVDLALNLLCVNAVERLTQRARFAPTAPLLRHRLIHLLPDPQRPEPPLIAHELKLDEQVVRWLLGNDEIDGRLAPFANLVAPFPQTLAPFLAETGQALLHLAEEALLNSEPLRLGFQGPAGNGQTELAKHLAVTLGFQLLSLDLGRLLANELSPEAALRLCFREARYHGAILYLDKTDALGSDAESGSVPDLRNALANHPGIVILSGERPWPQLALASPDLIAVPVPAADMRQRRTAWAAALASAGIALPPDHVALLAGRFRLSLTQIDAALASARALARWREATLDTEPTLPEIFQSARAQAGPALAATAQKIEPRFTWEDLVLPDDAISQLHEICARVNQRERVLATWGFAHKLSLGQGTNALFSGPSGTGKTMAAEVIASDLGLDLYRIELAGVVSKYIGETEKNLDGIFAAAVGANAILFFDEADALFGKRSEVRDAHDRYANIETAYLLQKMEQYDGVTILATNLRGNLDEAFTRRLAFTVHFPFPDESNRARIWSGIWPSDISLAPEVDLDTIARRFPLSGGSIKNSALAAAYLAADAGEPVTTDYLLHAIRREYQKMGKQLTMAELTGESEGGQ